MISGSRSQIGVLDLIDPRSGSSIWTIPDRGPRSGGSQIGVLDLDDLDLVDPGSGQTSIWSMTSIWGRSDLDDLDLVDPGSNIQSMVVN